MVDRGDIKSKLAKILCFAIAGATSLVGLISAIRWATTIWHYKAVGVDNTDEGYYLSAVLFPHQIPHAPTDFAFYLRPLWILFGQNLPAYRVGGFLFIIAVSTILAFELRRWIPASRPVGEIAFTALTTTAITAALSYQYVLWIPTPNYNLLGICLLTLSVSVLLAIVRHQTDTTDHAQDSKWYRWTPVSWGGIVFFTMFASRVTAGLIVGFVFVCVFLQRKKLNQWGRTFGEFGFGIAAGVLVHTLLTLRPPWRSAQSWMRSLELSQLRKDHSSSVLWEYDFVASHVRPWLIWVLLLIIGLLLVRRCVRHSQIKQFIALVVSVIAVTDMWVSRPSGGLLAAQNTVGWWWLRLAIYGVMVSMLIPEKISRKNFVGLGVIMLAIAGAIGSANGMYLQLIFTAGLLMIAVLIQLVVLIHQLGWRPLVVAPLCTFLLAFGFVGLTAARDTITTPYRTVGKLADSSQFIEYGNFGGLYVHPNSAAFISWIETIRKNLSDNVACIVNLEGATPVISALLHIPPAGTNWDLGSYPGSTAASARSLEIDNCWKENPFLLIDAPTGDTALPVPNEVQALCQAPFTTFELNTDHKALMRASLCNQTTS